MNKSDGEISTYVGNATLPAGIARLRQLVKDQLHLDLNVTPISVVIWQDNTTGPYRIKARLSASMRLDAGIAVWNKSIDNVTTLVSIANLHDPYLLAKAPGANGSITFYDGPYTNESIVSFTANRSYTKEPAAPDYLSRFTGDLNASDCCGIETMVTFNVSVPSTTPLYRNPMIDWCYWSGDCWRVYTGLSNIGVKRSFWTLEHVSDLPTITSHGATQSFYGFYLDIYHLEKYNITEYAQGVYPNECGCNWAHVNPATGQIQPQYEGPGCIGTPVPPFNDYSC
jgi:hypothetical protein